MTLSDELDSIGTETGSESIAAVILNKEPAVSRKLGSYRNCLALAFLLEAAKPISPSERDPQWITRRKLNKHNTINKERIWQSCQL